jgi:uncharacterized damage-inducible protein DinB
MSFREQKYLIVDARLSSEPEIGRWLWALEDTRRRTKARLADLPAAAIDWLSAEGESSIGTLLYHLALIEADWLCTEVLEQAYPPSIAALFPHQARDPQDQLTQVQGIGLGEHLARLDSVRAHVLQVYQAMDLHDFRRVRHLPDYDVTPEWVLHHLMQHEAEHRSQIEGLRALAERSLKHSPV